MNYSDFIERKSQSTNDSGFAPVWMPGFLFDFQGALVDWALRKGKSAVFADTGLGKSPISLVWADNVVRHTNRPALILTPLAVAPQFITEAEKFGIDCRRPGDAGAHVVVTNYERLHHLNAEDYAGVVCDESGCLKHFTGATQRNVTRFMLKTPYRLLASATPSPNDYIELGTSSEALGHLGYTEMLSRFFKAVEQGKISRIEEVKAARRDRGQAGAGNHFGKLSFRVSQTIGQYRLKGHAEQPFWKWVASWARACRKPSDLGAFDDARYVLPPLIERDHVVEPTRPAEGLLFTMPAFGLREERDERRRTLKERCELVAKLVDHGRSAVVWCHMNAEGDLLEKLIPGSVQVSGADEDDVKEARYAAFASGAARVLVTKPKCAAWGMNWQHCAHVVTFASHSFEQEYQSIRRCWRFGQTKPVTVDRISTTGEVHVRENLKRKAAQADAMFAELIAHMQDATRIERTNAPTTNVEVPSWL